MKSEVKSFSFLMELIIVILFFAISATICGSFIVGAKTKQVAATKLQNDLISAQTIIETMQSQPAGEIENLFTVKKIAENEYQKGDLVIKLGDNEGTVIIYNQKKAVATIPFVFGGGDNE